MRWQIWGTAAVLALLAGAAGLQAEETPGPDLEALSRHHARASLAEFREFLRLPNDANFPEQIRRNMKWVESAFARRGFSTKRLSSEGPPLVLAERAADGAPRTVMIYVHIDGQPVQPQEWDQHHPFQPVLKAPAADGWREIPWKSLEGDIDPDWRIFARSASDPKGPVGMLLAALDAADDGGLDLAHNIKIIMDFEEEQGSPHLPAAVSRHRDRLEADWLWIFDGPRHASNQPTIVFGARGIVRMTLKVFGPRAAVHSGHYGNYAPNPAQRLAGLLATFEDRDGRVAIEGFYDGISIDESAQRILDATPDDEDAMRDELGFAEAESVAPAYQESLQYPSLSVLGLSSSWTGEQTRTAIPPDAVAELDLRLVPESDPERLLGLIRDHIEERGWHLIGDREPTDAERRAHPRIASFTANLYYGAFRTPVDSPVGDYLTSAMTRAFGSPPVRIRILGGSVPISPFVNELDVPAVIVPAVNADNNQHSPNENLRLGNWFEGVLQYLSLLTTEHAE